MSEQVKRALIERGVVMPAPSSVVVGEEVDPDRIEAGCVLHPGVVLKGERTCLGAGVELGRAGGGCFVDVCLGRDVQIWGGVAQDVVCLDGVVVRGHAELRGGTLMEEGAEAAHHVGLKMTVLLQWVVTGSLINFCDALFAGGTSRKDHGEIGSCLALYNYTPWGDKFASMFGDVPNGVFLRSRRVFVGGQTQIVSPVRVGYGSVVPAGLSVRRPVGEGRMAGEAAKGVNVAFDPLRYGAVRPKVSLTVEYVANLYALASWYRVVRLPSAADGFEAMLWGEGLRQVDANVRERLKRLGAMMDRLPASLAAHRAAEVVDERRVREHEMEIAAWGTRGAVLAAPPGVEALEAALSGVQRSLARAPGTGWTDAVSGLDADVVTDGVAAMARFVEGVMEAAGVERVEAGA